MARYTRRKSTSAEDRSPAQVLYTSYGAQQASSTPRPWPVSSPLRSWSPARPSTTPPSPPGSQASMRRSSPSTRPSPHGTGTAAEQLARPSTRPFTTTTGSCSARPSTATGKQAPTSTPNSPASKTKQPVRQPPAAPNATSPDGASPSRAARQPDPVWLKLSLQVSRRPAPRATRPPGTSPGRDLPHASGPADPPGKPPGPAAAERATRSRQELRQPPPGRLSSSRLGPARHSTDRERIPDHLDRAPSHSGEGPVRNS